MCGWDRVIFDFILCISTTLTEGRRRLLRATDKARHRSRSQNGIIFPDVSSFCKALVNINGAYWTVTSFQCQARANNSIHVRLETWIQLKNKFQLKLPQLKFQVSTEHSEGPLFKFQVSSFNWTLWGTPLQVSSFKFQPSTFKFQLSSFNWTLWWTPLQVSSFKFQVSNHWWGCSGEVAQVSAGNATSMRVLRWGCSGTCRKCY